MRLIDTYYEKLKQLQKDKADVLSRIKPEQQKLSVVTTEINKLQADIDVMEREPRITDHARIRYLERVHGFDFEEQRALLLDDDAKAAIRMGVKKIKRKDYTLVVNGNSVVTVL